MLPVIDLDHIVYRCAAVGEEKRIIVEHQVIGSMEFKTRTELYGHWKKKNGGWLAEFNKKRESPITPEELTISDIQRPEPFHFVQHSAKLQFENVLKTFDTKNYIALIGGQGNFRKDVATLLGYKQNRDDMLLPVHLKDLKEYMTERYNPRIINGIETDDACVIECYKQPHKVTVSYDKDHRGCPAKLFNPLHPEEGVLDCAQFGKLWLNDKKEVKGIGRLWFYFQIMTGDATDNYKSNCFSDVNWGEKSSFNLLKDCKTDKEAFEALLVGFNKLYPEPKVVTGWRGNEIEIDALYVLQEMFILAHMRRWEDDSPVVTDILSNLKIKY